MFETAELLNVKKKLCSESLFLTPTSSCTVEFVLLHECFKVRICPVELVQWVQSFLCVMRQSIEPNGTKHKRLKEAANILMRSIVESYKYNKCFDLSNRVLCDRVVFQTLTLWASMATAASSTGGGRGRRPVKASPWNLKPWGTLGRCSTQRGGVSTASPWSWRKGSLSSSSEKVFAQSCAGAVSHFF